MAESMELTRPESNESAGAFEFLRKSRDSFGSLGSLGEQGLVTQLWAELQQTEVPEAEMAEAVSHSSPGAVTASQASTPPGSVMFEEEPEDRKRRRTDIDRKRDRKEARRASHKKVEQRRRERAQACFDELKGMLPASYNPKADKNSILEATIEYVKDLRVRQAQPEATAAPAPEYRAAFQLAKQGMAFAGIDARFWDVNEALCALTGYSAAELRGNSFMNLTLPEDLELFLGHARRLLTGDSASVTFSCRWLHRSGRTISVLVDLIVVRNEKGVPSSYVLYVRTV
mmetsp:Transcript_5267/g.12531  ORF Transcript_5267/g.12531 Transcript_5267/m.12531 type:complete len:286 (+) Transcript_5267:56-913(+)|eukprot:CAMPEP_0175935146 /NCGR_PEP_ID=MMETSP0108-20121206/20877_1 /TAXON_ID=195067 ORGANISM="Goniomonas pacifica, Strain CCMP1869" /NCGR_SAMPLE_ID=MMETSP0108 /ASSEMBLY_ACC=CAM_ASM_000204 /LENGTH=285 /DNA_ID=CAMNT_0017259051 /DNA_START=47 /DNA_END=904 /DNA_ORIENTATION=+